MKATVDANILFSALLRKSITRRIWFNPELELYAPAHLLAEFQKYRCFLLKKFGGSEDEFSGLYLKLLSQVHFIPDDKLKPFLPAAASLSGDPKDLLYLACSLAEDTILWSNDKGFKKQSRIMVLNTEEIVQEIGML